MIDPFLVAVILCGGIAAVRLHHDRGGAVALALAGMIASGVAETVIYGLTTRPALSSTIGAVVGPVLVALISGRLVRRRAS